MRTLAIFLALSMFFTKEKGEEKIYRYIPNNCFSPGEIVEYRVHYAFLNAAEGRVILYNDLYEVNGRISYKVDVFGRSVGLFDWIMTIRDNWGTFIDTASIIPHHFYRNIREGSYRKYEKTDFDHEKDTVTVTTLDKVTREVSTIEKFPVPDNSQDMVSAYYYLRLLDFKRYSKGDTIKIDAFFDDESYDFKIRYLGRERLKTSIGKKKSIVLQPIMPKNSLFDGKDAIKFWVSDDKYKIPLKIKADMFVGAVEVDVTTYKPGRED